MLVPKLLLTPIKIRILGPKTAKFGPKYAFFVILGQILAFLPILSHTRPKTNASKVPRWVFHLVGNKTFDFSSKNFAQNWLFCSFWAWPCWLIWCPVGGLAGGCGAGFISQDTYLLYMIYKIYEIMDECNSPFCFHSF